MQLLRPVLVDPGAPLARANPVAKLAAASVLFVALVASLDAVTALVILAALIAVVPVSGLSARALTGRVWPLLVAAAAIGLVNVVFAAQQIGPTAIAVGPIRIGFETLLAGAGLGLRLAAIAGAGILATASTDPTDMADALIQQLRVSPRFAVGTLAALRLGPLMAREWQTIGLARRARGVDAGRNPLAAVRLAAGRMLGLLVGTVRRAGRMALAMDARGLGAQPCRTSARLQRMHPADWVWVAGAATLAVAAIAFSVALGTWRPLFG